jgi:hypothetical protein
LASRNFFDITAMAMTFEAAGAMRYSRRMRLPSTTPQQAAAVWNGRDDICGHYMGRVPITERVVTLTLNWKRSKSSHPELVGRFRLDMDQLVSRGYTNATEELWQNRHMIVRIARLSLCSIIMLTWCPHTGQVPGNLLK